MANHSHSSSGPVDGLLAHRLVARGQGLARDHTPTIKRGIQTRIDRSAKTSTYTAGTLPKSRRWMTLQLVDVNQGPPFGKECHAKSLWTAFPERNLPARVATCVSVSSSCGHSRTCEALAPKPMIAWSCAVYLARVLGMLARAKRVVFVFGGRADDFRRRGGTNTTIPSFPTGVASLFMPKRHWTSCAEVIDQGRLMTSRGVFRSCLCLSGGWR